MNFWRWMSRSNICLRWVSYVWTRYVSWNSENWVASKPWYFHCLGHSLFCWPFQLNKNCFQKNDLHKLKLVPRGTRMIYIHYLKLCNTLLQIWCIGCYTQLVLLYEIWKSIGYPYYYYSLLCILLLHVFCSTIWNLVEHKLLFPVLILHCILLFFAISVMTFMRYSL